MKESKIDSILMVAWLIAGQTADVRWFALLAFIMSALYGISIVLNKIINN